MQSTHDIANAALELIPGPLQLTQEHKDCIARHSAALKQVGPQVVQEFYETVYAHESTERVFKEGERPMREDSLLQWWDRTVEGPVDDEYWSWMALVGLIHVVRRVANPSMLSMAQFVGRRSPELVAELGLDDQEAAMLRESMQRLMSTVSALITYGYDHAVSSALYEIAGMPEPLLHRLRDKEVNDAIETTSGRRIEAAPTA